MPQHRLDVDSTALAANALRASRAPIALQYYLEIPGSDDEHLIVDLLSDLMHFCITEDVCFGCCLDTAERHFVAERLEARSIADVPKSQ